MGVNGGRSFCCLTVLLHILSVQCQQTDEEIAFATGTNTVKFEAAKPVRYLLYEVNYGEGFNLRRDVYIRMSNLVKALNEEEPWVLVLPPWSRVYHWQSKFEQERIPWSHFFDLESLRRHVPAMEFSDYLKVRGEGIVEEVIHLQKYKEGWNGGKWEEKIDERECLEARGFHKDSDGNWQWYFWDNDVKIGSFRCWSVQAQYTFIKPYILGNTTGRAVMLVRGEELIHGLYSEWSPEWWTGRRSLIFSQKLRKIANGFRKDKLDSTDEQDMTTRDEDWRTMRREHGTAKGGPYLAVHLRRKDFLRAHKKEVPSIKFAAEQIRVKLKKHKLDTVFLATDGTKAEVNELQGYLSDYQVLRFVPSDKKTLRELKDGGVAVIDQWICAHARYFIGSYVSTFSFRIQEEREILGFEQDLTFNRLCGDDEGTDCEQPTKWSIKL